MRYNFLNVICILLFCLTLSPILAQEPETYFPTNAWRTSTPEEQAMDSAMLAGAIDFLAENDEFNVHSLMVIRNGYVVTDAYFYPYTSGEPHDVASVTKSVISTLVGIAIQQRHIEGVDQRISDLISVPEDQANITLEDLLTMRSGIECIVSPFEVTLSRMMLTPDWIQFVQNLPVDAESGTKWVYYSPAVHLLAALLESATGQTTYDFAVQNLFDPLGIQDVGWPLDPQGVVHGWGDLRLTPDDMAKIGYLYLNDGIWDGKQLLPDGWVTQTTHNIRSEGEQGYGYLWWLYDSFYEARGRGGQRIFVYPDKDLIVVMTGSHEGNYNLFLSQYILPAIQSEEPLAENSAGEATLQNAIENVAQVPDLEAQPVDPLPPLAQKISGKTITLEPNPFGLLTLSLSFTTNNEAVLYITSGIFLTGDEEFSWTAGLDGVPRIAPGRFDISASATGQWEEDNVFTMAIDEVANNQMWEIELTFDSGNVTAALRGTAGNFAVDGTIED